MTSEIEKRLEKRDIIYRKNNGDANIIEFNKACAGYEYSLRGWLPEGKEAKILDLGCGEGRLLYYLTSAKGYTEVKGVDISESQIAIAESLNLDVHHGNVFDFLKQSQEKFDLIITLDLIEHFKKDEVIEFLDLCHQRIKKNGRIIIQTPNPESPFFGQIRYGDFTHELCMTPDILSRLMKNTGFNSIETRDSPPIPVGYSFISTIRYLLWKPMHYIYCLIHLIETGSIGSGVFTRVFYQSGVKFD